MAVQAIHQLEWHVGALSDAAVQSVAAGIFSGNTAIVGSSRPVVAPPRNEIPLVVMSRPDSHQGYESEYDCFRTAGQIGHFPGLCNQGVCDDVKLLAWWSHTP